MARIRYKELKKSKLYLRIDIIGQSDKRVVHVYLMFLKDKSGTETIAKYRIRFRPVTGYYSYMWQCTRHIKHETAEQWFSGKKNMTKALMAHINLALKDYVH